MSTRTHFSPVPDVPDLARVMGPTVTVEAGVAHALVEDVEGHDVTLRFRPYQGVRLTTIDCFR